MRRRREDDGGTGGGRSDDIIHWYKVEGLFFCRVFANVLGNLLEFICVTTKNVVKFDGLHGGIGALQMFGRLQELKERNQSLIVSFNWRGMTLATMCCCN